MYGSLVFLPVCVMLCQLQHLFSWFSQSAVRLCIGLLYCMAWSVRIYSACKAMASAHKLEVGMNLPRCLLSNLARKEMTPCNVQFIDSLCSTQLKLLAFHQVLAEATHAGLQRLSMPNLLISLSRPSLQWF